MTRRDLDELARSFDSEAYEPERRLAEHIPVFATLVREIIDHARARFWHYIPSYTDSLFINRLEAWLGNETLGPEDIKVLLQLVPQLQFVDREDMLSLYRAAFSGPIARWIMDEAGLDFGLNRERLGAALAEGVRQTWFCPVTDSMDIAQFDHVNHIVGQAYRPAWRVLGKLGDIGKIREYIRREGFVRVVLLEDFVGTGMQCRGPVQFAVRNLCPEIPVLFVPLIISGANLEVFRASLDAAVGFSFAPLSVVPRHMHVLPEEQAGEPTLIQRLREIVAKTFAQVRRPSQDGEGELDEPFGFGSLGMLAIMYTNCPNNTLPLLHHSNREWAALFPRVSRR